MNSTPGELYVLGIIISTLLSLIGFANLILNWKENKFFGIFCLFFASINWQVVIYLSYYDIVFEHGTYNVSSFIPVISEIAKTSIEYLLMGGIVAGLVLFILSKKDYSDKLQHKLNTVKSKYINKKEIAKEIEPYKPTTKRIVKKRIVKKPIKKE